MAPRVRLVLALHDHQPVGNFDGVFAAAHDDSYAPFLEVLAEFPGIPVSLHTSGSLLEWLVAHRPEYVDRVRGLVARGQVEILGGPFYEPILACIPRRDRIGQIAAYSRYLHELFGRPVRGMWIPERVWEQSFASDIVAAGIEYTILDDFHFRCAGLGDDELLGWWTTEDEGELLAVFPGSETLRYTIPFAEPQRTIEHLRSVADRRPGSVVVFGDDGEKFGTWPGTRDHVYRDGWLRRFFETLRDNADWLEVCTLEQAVARTAPRGTCHIPDGSYREMTEWALPVSRQAELADLASRRGQDPDWSRIRSFVRGGSWRNFRRKYPEANQMYCRMLEVSRRLAALDVPGTDADPALLARARTELYRAQCNCPYWHGAFGGLYLPHLRHAVYRHLIAADTLLEQASARPARWVQIDAADYDLDARKEIRLAGDRLVAYLSPSDGGHLYELDVRGARHNLGATLDRREEVYHAVVRAAGHRHEGDAHHGHGDGHAGDGSGAPASIHDLVRFKQPDLDRRIVYDKTPRRSLVDHFLQPGLTLDRFRAGDGEVGDFATGVHEAVLRRSDDRIEARLSRTGSVGPYRIRLEKTVALDARSGGALHVDYVLSDLPPRIPLHFAVETNFAGLPPGQPDRYYYDGEGGILGRLESALDLAGVGRIGLIDEWLGLDVALDLSVPADLWTFPIETISQSEGGFELVQQSCAVVPHWTIRAGDDGTWQVRIVLSVDTSAAQARTLHEAAAVRA